MAAEKGHQRRSQSCVSLRRTLSGTPQSPHSLRPCWMTFLSSLELHVFSLQREQTLKLVKTWQRNGTVATASIPAETYGRSNHSSIHKAFSL